MKVSIVVPAFNEQVSLDYSLATLEVQRRTFHECIVVDDGSNPPLKIPSWCRTIRIDREMVHRGSSSAKNKGAAAAKGDTLCFCDSDIVHMPDAIESLSLTMMDWKRGEKRGDILLNTMRGHTPRDGFDVALLSDMNRFLDVCRDADGLNDEDMKKPVICWEQNCGMIYKDYFFKVGAYDEAGFPNWGLNNQDLCARVLLDGGHVTSFVKRASTGKRLHCFHLWHDNKCNQELAKEEWVAKWGEPHSNEFMARAYHEGQCEREDCGISVRGRGAGSAGERTDGSQAPSRV